MLAEVASRQPYLAVPESLASNTTIGEAQAGTLIPWEKLLTAVNMAYRKDFPGQGMSTDAGVGPVTRPNQRQLRRTEYPRKPWSLAEDIALVTLKREGLSYSQIARHMPDRKRGGISQRWYKIKRYVEMDSREASGADANGGTESRDELPDSEDDGDTLVDEEVSDLSDLTSTESSSELI